MRAERATVAYDEMGAAHRYTDIAVLRLDVLPTPEDASSQDPDVDLTGTLVLPPERPDRSTRISTTAATAASRSRDRR